jgi:hypothetical protein
MIRIVSDGTNHRVLNENGEPLTNVLAIAIDELYADSYATATIRLFNVPLDITIDKPQVQMELL